MIALLTGVIEESGDGRAVIDVGGVGYQVLASNRTLARLPAIGESVRLFIETHVREDHIHLFGFLEAGEREWFRLLLTVQGVGARMALSILGVLSPAELALAIAAEDRAALTRADGVGPKLASRVLNELKDKGPALGPAALAAGPDGDASLGNAVAALVNLGYRRSEAVGAVGHAARQLGGDASIEALIRAGLQELGA